MGWRHRGVLRGLLPGQVLQRLAEQIIEDVDEEEICGAALGREPLAVLNWKPGHYFFEPHCTWQSLAFVFMRQSTEAVGIISRIFYVKVNSDPEVHGGTAPQQALHVAVGGGGCTVFSVFSRLRPVGR